MTHTSLLARPCDGQCKANQGRFWTHRYPRYIWIEKWVASVNFKHEFGSNGLEQHSSHQCIKPAMAVKRRTCWRFLKRSFKTTWNPDDAANLFAFPPLLSALQLNNQCCVLIQKRWVPLKEGIFFSYNFSWIFVELFFYFSLRMN